jgi:hypothetical protein
MTHVIRSRHERSDLDLHRRGDIRAGEIERARQCAGDDSQGIVSRDRR